MRSRVAGAVGAGALVVGVAVAAYPALLRTRCLTWGATSDEINRQMPGDDLLPDPDIVATRAVTVAAPPHAIWPWLVQMGSGRGGLYTYDWIENLFGLGMHSANEILPDFQDLEVGDVLPVGSKGPRMKVEVGSSCGSVENLNVSRRHGCNPHLRQILATHTFEIPSCSANSRLDQCVTPSRSGGGSSVASTTATSSTVFGRPGFGRSSRPASPSAAYRFFHPITVGLDAPVRVAISFVPTPSAANNTIRARRTGPAGIDVERSHDSNTLRSAAGTSTATVNDIPQSTAR